MGVRRLSIVAALLERVDEWLGLRLDFALGEVGGGGDCDTVLAKLDERDLDESPLGDARPAFAPSFGVVTAALEDALDGVVLRGEDDVDAAGDGRVLVIRPLSGVAYVDEAARGVPPCWTAGELGMGLETILGEPIWSALVVAVSAAFAARRFSASRAEIALCRFGTVGRAAATSCTTALASPGLAFSNCFLADPSRPSMIPLARTGQMECIDQNAARAKSRTAGLTSARPRLIAPSSMSSRPVVDSIADLVR